MAEPWRIDSAMPGIVWPGLPAPAATLGLLQQLEDTQWWPPERLHEMQSRQLDLLLRHAHETVPYYRERWKARPTASDLPDLPILTRAELQAQYGALQSRRVPAAHGRVSEGTTSGTSGMPVRVRQTELVGLLWNVFTLRDHLWHRRDLRGKLATVRINIEAGAKDNWGPATTGLARTGPVVFRGVDADASALLDWLGDEKPDCLLTYPTLAAELAALSLEKGRALKLAEVRTFGEMLRAGVHELCREAWGAKLTDIYSAVELGNIALQCPEGERYHVQSEGVVVEVLDDEGRPCPPGTVGRLVMTSLHNFAMPLIRYEIGDYAEAGAPCSCGRGLPVISRIAGRARGMLTAPDGKRYWPYFGSRGLLDVAPVKQMQVVQKDRELLEVRLVVASPLSGDQEERLRRHLHADLPAGLKLAFSYWERIPRSAGGKFEDFYSEIGQNS